MAGGCDLRAVELHEGLAGLDFVAGLDEAIEAVAVHFDGVDADVDEQFHVARTGDADGVLGVCDGRDGAVIGSEDGLTGRVDADAGAEDAGREGRIGDVGVGDRVALDGSVDVACFTGDDGSLGLRSLSGHLVEGFLLFLGDGVFFPDDGGQKESGAGGDEQFNGVNQRMVDGQEARDTGDTVSGGAEGIAGEGAVDGCEERTDGAADHTADEGFHEPEVDTEDSGFGDAEGSGQRGRKSDRAGLLLVGLDRDSKAGAELCEVGSGGDGHPDVEACLTKHTGFDDVVHMVETKDDGDGVDGTHEECADAVADGDEPLRESEDPGFNEGEDRADDGHGQERRAEDRGQRDHEEVEGLRYVFVQPFLDL